MKESKRIKTTLNSVVSNATLLTIRNILQSNFKHKNFFFQVSTKNKIIVENIEDKDNYIYINNLITSKLTLDNKTVTLIKIPLTFLAKNKIALICIIPISTKMNFIIHSFSKKNYDTQGEIKNNFDFVSDIKNIVLLENFRRKNKSLEKKLSKKKLKTNKIIKSNNQSTEDLKTIFLANLSHEIKTPMNSIIGFTDLLQIPGLQSDKVVKFANIANNNAKRLLNLLEDIIDLSKIETNNIKIKNEEITIQDLLNKTYVLNNSKLLKNKEKSLDFSVSLPTGVKLQKINADIERIKQVLTVLLSNAFNFTSEGSVILGAKIEQENKIQFYVKDTGCGIKEENKKDIFKSFRQGGHFLKRNHEGSGLGLALAKGLLDLYGTELLYKSHEKVGSVFYFTLPISS